MTTDQDSKEVNFFRQEAARRTLRGAIGSNPAAAVRVFGPQAVIVAECGTESQAVESIKRISGIDLEAPEGR